MCAFADNILLVEVRVFILLKTVSPEKLPGGCQQETIGVIRESLFFRTWEQTANSGLAVT